MLYFCVGKAQTHLNNLIQLIRNRISHAATVHAVTQSNTAIVIVNNRLIQSGD